MRPILAMLSLVALLAGNGAPAEPDAGFPGCQTASAILLVPNPGPAQPPSAFLLACNAVATDVVVTDVEGRVLESWRGGLQPGDTVRLGPAHLSPANALPCEHLRLRPERALSAIYRKQEGLARRAYIESDPSTLDALWPTATDGAETDLRLVLFLRKGAVIPGIEPVWLPAQAVPEGEPNPLHGGWCTGARVSDQLARDDFSTCVALVEAGRVVAPQEPRARSRFGWGWWDPLETALIAGTLKEFKDEVTRLPRPALTP